MPDNEKTHAHAASLAGEFMGADEIGRIRFAVNRPHDLATIVASALTQARDHGVEPSTATIDPTRP